MRQARHGQCGEDVLDKHSVCDRFLQYHMGQIIDKCIIRVAMISGWHGNVRKHSQSTTFDNLHIISISDKFALKR